MLVLDDTLSDSGDEDGQNKASNTHHEEFDRNFGQKVVELR